MISRRSPQIDGIIRRRGIIIGSCDDPDCGYVEWRENDKEHPLYLHIFFMAWRRKNGELANIQRVGNPEIVADNPELWKMEKSLASAELSRFVDAA